MTLSHEASHLAFSQWSMTGIMARPCVLKAEMRNAEWIACLRSMLTKNRHGIDIVFSNIIWFFDLRSLRTLRMYRSRKSVLVALEEWWPAAPYCGWMPEFGEMTSLLSTVNALQWAGTNPQNEMARRNTAKWNVRELFGSMYPFHANDYC